MKRFKVIVTINIETGATRYIYAVNKEHAEYIVMNHYELVGKDFISVEATEVE